MKIPLRVGKIFSKQEALSPILSMRVRKEHVHPPIFGTIYALVDTGSSTTHLSYKDTEGLNIQMKKLPEAHARPITIGGCRFKGKILKDIIVKLTKEDKSPYSMNVSEMIVVGEPVESLEKKGKSYKILPSIIGTDFLEKYRFALYFDPSKKEAYLELEE